MTWFSPVYFWKKKSDCEERRAQLRSACKKGLISFAISLCHCFRSGHRQSSHHCPYILYKVQISWDRIKDAGRAVPLAVWGCVQHEGPPVEPPTREGRVRCPRRQRVTRPHGQYFSLPVHMFENTFCGQTTETSKWCQWTRTHAKVEFGEQNGNGLRVFKVSFLLFLGRARL